MLAVFACLVGVFGILTMAEMMWRTNVLKGEYERKFVHVPAATFFAFWPWLLSWRQIQFLGLAMLIVLAANKRDKTLHFSAELRKRSLGGASLAIAVVLCGLLTTNKLFFAIALLHISLADGFAAVFGTLLGQNWQYKVFGQVKSVIGTMTFWLASFFILGVALLFDYGQISSNSYTTILLLLPPILAAIENFTPLGLDNLSVPLIALIALKIFAT